MTDHNSRNYSPSARLFWLLGGIVALILAAIGVLLPVMPTTPFILVAAFCFSRSSRRLEAWLLANPTFGPVILDWRESGAIAPRIKLIAVGLMCVTFLSSVILGLGAMILLAQAVCLGGASTYVLTRPSH